MKNNIITALDIGTGSIKGLVVRRRQNSSNFEILGQAKKFSLGIRKGTIVDPIEVSKNIHIVIDKLQAESGQKIEGAYVNLGGSHIFCVPSHGSVIVSRADQKISQEDIDRVIESAKAFSLPLNKEILEVFPKEFIVDGQKGIKQPLEMQGVRLETEVLALCAFSPYLKNLSEAVLSSELQIDDIIPSPLCSSRAVLEAQQKELGVIVIDIGAGTTSLAVYNEGDLIHTAIIPIGSANITQDIAIGLQTDIEVAEKIKNKFGACVLTNSNKNKKEKIILEDSSSLTFSHKMLVKIIESRVSEIFDLIGKEMKKISPQPLLPAGVVLTGGGAKMPKIIDLAKKELKLPVQIKGPQGFSGLEEDISMSAVCGLILEEAEIIKEPSFPGSGAVKGIFTKIKKLFKVFIP